jgi:hypothetical protein
MNQPLPSNRSFGLLFFVVFGSLATLGWWRGTSWYPVVLALSVAFLVLSFTIPQVLQPLNRAWMAFALLLHKVTSPLILGALFFVLFTPVGLIMRLKKRDVLRRRLDRSAGSYWIPRSPAGPAPESLRDQY